MLDKISIFEICLKVFKKLLKVVAYDAVFEWFFYKCVVFN